MIFSHFWQIIRSCERVKVRNPRARLWANTCKNHDIIYWALAPQNAGRPPIFISCIKRLWVVDIIWYGYLPVRMSWRHRNVIQTKKNWFQKNAKLFFNFKCLHLNDFFSILFEFSICYSWIIALSMIYSTLFILTIVSWSKLWLKIFCQTYSGLRVMSMGIEFCQNPELTC